MLSKGKEGPNDGKNSSNAVRTVFGVLFNKWDVPHSTVKVALAAAVADQLTGINLLRMLWIATTLK